jgi:hypothetical protein
MLVVKMQIREELGSQLALQTGLMELFKYNK